MIKHKSFVLHKDWISEVQKLTNEQSGILFISILEFVNDIEPLIYDVKVQSIYDAIIEQIVFEWNKFNPKTKKFHWNYQGGTTPENKVIRNSKEMGFWRSIVFKRDNYTCQKCFVKGGSLNAHHIKRFATHPELRTEISNGLTLCVQCHRQEHKKSING